MTDPVMAMDGHTYERSAIEKWLVTNNTSPLNNSPLPAKTLIPNHNLKSQITDWKKKSVEVKASAPVAAPVAAEILPLDAIEIDEKKQENVNVGGMEIDVSKDSAGIVRLSVHTSA